MYKLTGLLKIVNYLQTSRTFQGFGSHTRIKVRTKWSGGLQAQHKHYLRTHNIVVFDKNLFEKQVGIFFVIIKL